MRKGMAQGLARPADYDRNSVAKNNNFGPGNAAPTAPTTRWTYTVPAGKKTRIASISAAIVRSTAATTVGLAHVEVQYVPSGGSSSNNCVCMIDGNVVGQSMGLAIGSSLIMNVGDAINGVTTDNSSGGTCDIAVAWSGNEFDV